MLSKHGSRVVTNGFVANGVRKRAPRPRSRAVVVEDVSKTTNSSSIRQRLGNVPSLKEFMHKQKVIHQYRHFFRASNLIDDLDWKNHCINEVRISFQLHKNETNRLSQLAAFKEGEKKLQQFQSMVGYVDPHSNSRTDEDSWLNIKDEEDPRGRVGVDWPWSKRK